MRFLTANGKCHSQGAFPWIGSLVCLIMVATIVDVDRRECEAMA